MYIFSIKFVVVYVYSYHVTSIIFNLISHQLSNYITPRQNYYTFLEFHRPLMILVDIFFKQYWILRC